MNAQFNPAQDSSSRIRDLFELAVDLPGAERTAALLSARASAREMAIVEKLLAADFEKSVPFFQTPAAEWAQQLKDEQADIDAMFRQQAGPYKLIELIAKGGSSIVFRATRTIGGAEQVVALKLLHNGLFSPEARRRFRREQAILTQLNHPNIARLIDAGVTDAGTPYIAMEKIDGTDLLSYVDANALGQQARLRLVIDLCRAVDAAHRALIVHRDLKPSNVLVNTEGHVKVLDFGIAKLADDGELATATQHISLTPGYAAPEQYESGPVTTSADVYALGVITSELLLGVRLGADATRPQAALSAQTETRRRWRKLDTDLVNILRAALASEPERRYSSAGHLADDIGRYLRKEPIAVAPLTRWYRSRKFVARNRAMVLMAAVFVVAVAAAFGMVLWQAAVAREHATAAIEQAQRAEAVRDLLVSVFNAASADLPKDKRPSAQEIVGQATSRVSAQTALPNALGADLLLNFARVSNGLGAYDQAISQLDLAMPIIDRLYGARSQLWWDAIVLRGSVLQHTSKFAESIDLLAPLEIELAARQDRIGVDGLLALSDSLIHRGQIDHGLGLAREAVLIAQEHVNQVPDEVLLAMINEVSLLLDAMHFSEAFQRADETLALWHKEGDPACHWISTMYENLATAAEAEGDIPRAESAYKEAIAQNYRFSDKPNPSLAWDIGIYGTFLIAQGRIDEAEPYARKGLEMRREVFGEADHVTLNAVAGMVKFYLGKHDFSKAIDWGTQGVEVCHAHAIQDVVCARMLALRARAYGHSGQFAKSERDLKEAYALQRELGGEDTPSYAYILDNALVVQVIRHDYNAALATADRIINIRQKVKGGMIQADLSTRFRRAQALFGLERIDEALAELTEIEPRYESLFPKGDLRFDMLELKAKALARARRGRDARHAAQHALALESKEIVREPATISELKQIAKPTTLFES